MAFYGDNDIASMLQDVGVAVSAAGVNTYGALDLTNEQAVAPDGKGDVVLHRYLLTVRVNDFPAGALDIDQPITADGVNYVIREHLHESDGAVIKLLLRKA